MTTPYTSVRGRDQILAAYGPDPCVSCFATHEATGLVADSAVAWTRRFHGRRSVMGLGDPQTAATLVAELADRHSPERFTAPQDVYDAMPSRWRPESVGRWHWFYTRSAPGSDSADGQWFDESDYAEIGSLLDVAFPNASNRPAVGEAGRRWFGARDEDGRIVACGNAFAADGAGPSLGSIAVHPDARRRGLASRITSWVTGRLLAEGNSMVSLGSYAGEEATHRIYRRLGYVDTHVMVSGRLSRN